MKRLGLMFGLSLILAGCATPSCLTSLQPWPDPSGKHLNLQQCWSKHDQIRFYTTNQGSQIVKYEFVKPLEMPSSTEKFLSRANIEKWRFLLLEKTDIDADSDVDKDVPDWPLGFVIDDVTSGKQEWRGKWLGVTCAACHTAQIEYRGKKIRITGGPSMANANQFLWDLRDAFKSTYEDGRNNGEKFKRYAQHFPQDNAKDLLTRLGAVVKERDEWHQRNDPPAPPGFARLDAFGVIFNQIIHMTGSKPFVENDAPDPKTDAPVSYPVLWDTTHHNQTQWNGASPAIPMARNIIQALGVFAKYNEDAGWFEEPSTIRLSNQREIQKLVNKLRSPKWPENILGVIDQKMAEKGEMLFSKPVKEGGKNCRSCHAEQKREEPLQRIKMSMIKQEIIKTDINMVHNADHRKLSDPDGSPKSLRAADGTAARDIAFSWSHLSDAFAFLGEVISALVTPEQDLSIPGKDVDLYKARPLDGIWASAPYLHNGSVPNLYELLRPADKRMKTFYVGSREFDPKKVGFDTDDKRGTLLDTTIKGNSNSGHDTAIYGGELKDEEIWQLVEYLKTL